MPSEGTTLRQLATLRLDEAKLLLRERHFSGAYYLAGYAIECALKASIAAQFRGNEIPDKNLVNKVYTHDLPALVGLAGLEAELKTDTGNDAEFKRRWDIVKNWSEQARYTIWTEEQAKATIDAVDGSGEAGGLFQWLSTRR